MPDYIHEEKDKFVQLLGEDDFHKKILHERGPKFAEYRLKWEKAGRFELETPVPLHVDFELTTYCNLRCPMCVFGVPKEKRPATFNAVRGAFPFDLFKKVIDEGVPLGLSAIDLSYYNEPLLRKELFDFIDYANENGVLDIMMSSNGELLTPEITEKILDSGLTRFMISLDAATEKTYEQVRVGGEFSNVMRNVEYFLARKKERRQVLPITRVSFVKTSINEGEVGDFLKKWKPLVDYVSIQELIAFDAMEKDMTPSTKRVNPDFKCHQPWHRLTMRADGQALPCCVIYGQELKMGNIKNQSLQEIWLSPQMRHLRKIQKEGLYMQNDVCMKCVSMSVG